MRLTDDGARPDHFSPLAPGVARGTDLIQPPKGWRQAFGLWQGPLSGRFTRAIHVKHSPGIARSIYQAPGLLLGGLVSEWAAEQVIEKQRPQCFDGGLRQRR